MLTEELKLLLVKIDGKMNLITVKKKIFIFW